MSETTADTAPTPDAPDTPTPDEKAGDTPDLTAEVEKWKTQSRKHEERAKANAKAANELEALKLSSMGETEKAVAQAKLEGRQDALREAGSRLVNAEVRAAAAGRNIDVDALLEGLDASKFVDDDGEADRLAIMAWVEKVAPKATEDGDPPFPDLGQGFRVPAEQQLGTDALTKSLTRLVNGG